MRLRTVVSSFVLLAALMLSTIPGASAGIPACAHYEILYQLKVEDPCGEGNNALQPVDDLLRDTEPPGYHAHIPLPVCRNAVTDECAYVHCWAHLPYTVWCDTNLR